MAESTLDFDELMAPFPGDNPAGINLREEVAPDAVYQQIRNARSEARAEERRQSKDQETNPDWGPVLSLGRQAIVEKSKDIDVATYMLEALIRKHGFGGLRDGLKLIRLMVERFWDSLYPQPDEEGQAGRVGILMGVMETFPVQINRIPLTEVGAADKGPFNRWHYERAPRIAATLESLKEAAKREQLLSEKDTVTQDMIRQAEAESSPPFYGELLESLTEAMNEQQQLFALLADRCGTDERGLPLVSAPSGFREALEGCLKIIAPIAKEKMPAEPVMEHVEQTPGEGPKPERGPAGEVSGRITTRNEAFETLLRVARFFRETEPQSPVSYALERIVRWGKLPLPELWSELIEEGGARSKVFKLVGIQPREGGEEKQ
jgi:type VI secretion system protein ImpA